MQGGVGRPRASRNSVQAWVWCRVVEWSRWRSLAACASAPPPGHGGGVWLERQEAAPLPNSGPRSADRSQEAAAGPELPPPLEEPQPPLLSAPPPPSSPWLAWAWAASTPPAAPAPRQRHKTGRCGAAAPPSASPTGALTPECREHPERQLPRQMTLARLSLLAPLLLLLAACCRAQPPSGPVAEARAVCTDAPPRSRRSCQSACRRSPVAPLSPPADQPYGLHRRHRRPAPRRQRPDQVHAAGGCRVELRCIRAGAGGAGLRRSAARALQCCSRCAAPACHATWPPAWRAVPGEHAVVGLRPRAPAPRLEGLRQLHAVQ